MVNGVSTVRHLGYDAPQPQAMPALPAGVQPGAPRSAWTQESEHVRSDDPRLIWSEAELAQRAAHADAITARQEQIHVQVAGSPTPQVYEKQAAAARREHIDLGIAGTTVFAQLSYYRCALTAKLVLRNLHHHAFSIAVIHDDSDDVTACIVVRIGVSVLVRCSIWRVVTLKITPTAWTICQLISCSQRLH